MVQEQTRRRPVTALVKELEPRLISYLRYSCGTGSDAEDLFQEVCLKLYRHWPEVATLDRPQAWVFRVARNLAANRHKRRDIERRALQRPVLSAPRALESVDRTADRAEATWAIQQALSGLPSPQREAVCLKIWGECSWGEIGQQLEVSADTAARLFGRGLRSIAPQLKGFGGEA